MFILKKIENVRLVDVGLKTVVETKIPYPYGYMPAGIVTVVGNLLDLTKANYASDLLEVNIGVSPRSYIQYSITESNYIDNDHTIYILFVKIN